MSLLTLNNTLYNPWARTYVVTLVFLSFAAGLFWLDYFRVYETEVQVLFVTKSDQQAETVAESMASIMQTLGFAERLQRDFPDVDLGIAAENPDDKKREWNQNLRVDTSAGGGVLIFSQRHESATGAKELAKATLKTLLVATNIYYDRPNDVEIRITEGSITSPVVGSKLLLVLVSFGSSFLVTTLFFGVIGSFGFLKTPHTKQGSSLNIEKHIGESVPWIDPNKFRAVRPQSLEYQESILSDEVLVEREILEKMPAKSPSIQAKKASAPGNLPIMEGALPQFGFTEEVSKGDTPLEISKENISSGELIQATEINPEKEPTAEDYKRRLNELLKGNSF